MSLIERYPTLPSLHSSYFLTRSPAMNALLQKGAVSSIIGYDCGPANGLRLNVVNPGFGIFMLIVGLVMQIIYPIYYYVLYSKGDLQYSSYKILLYIGILQQSSLLFNSIATGIFLIFDIEFCDQSTLIYIFGCLITGIWFSFTTSSVLLLFNRVVEIYSRNHMTVLFGGVRTYLWCAVSLSIGILAFFYSRPVIFNADALSWIWDPQIPNDGYDYQHYTAPLININNISTCSLFLFLYLFLIVGAVRKKSRLVPIQIEVLKQSFVIGLFSLSTSSLYILMQFLPVPPFIITLSFLFYVGSSVVPGLVFVIFNLSVREAVIRVFTCSYRVNYPHITLP